MRLMLVNSTNVVFFQSETLILKKYYRLFKSQKFGITFIRVCAVFGSLLLILYILFIHVFFIYIQWCVKNKLKYEFIGYVSNLNGEKS
jgi:hypothetical protein